MCTGLWDLKARKKKKKDEGLPGTSYYLFSYHSSSMVPGVLVLELKIPHPKRLFSCGQTGAAIAHPMRQVRGWRCVSWGREGRVREEKNPAQLWDGKGGICYLRESFELDFNITHWVQHRAGNVLWVTDWGVWKDKMVSITKVGMGLMGYKTHYPQHMAPWHTEYFKLKEVEKKEEAGRSLWPSHPFVPEIRHKILM